MKWAAPYDEATRCTGGPTQGARALLAYSLDRWGARGVRSLGIYNCRSVRGGSTTSTHGAGRGIDLGLPATPGKQTKLGLEIVHALGEHGDKLGVQCVIYGREIWSARSRDGRHYGGVAPHWDHAHVELTREAAATLTLARVRLILGAEPRGGWDAARPGPSITDRKKTAARATPLIAIGSRWENAVREIQKHLTRHGFKVAVDGDFGPGTQAAVIRFQRARRLPTDGQVTPRTWHALRAPSRAAR